MKLTAKATIQIQKPVHEVFEAIVDPGIMSKYFIHESSGRLSDGQEVFWSFPEFPDKFPVKNVSLEKDSKVSFTWDKETIVTISLTVVDEGNTIVKVHEGDKVMNEDNLKWVIQNTEGWANFLACMKAWLEYGVQLRKGAFDFMKKA